MNIEKAIIETLKREVTPAIGCTEPVAVALAAAKVKELMPFGVLELLEVYVSPNIYKNGLAVGVPPTDEVGLEIAAVLGYVGGDSSKGLKVLESITQEDIQQAKALLKEGRLKLSIKNTTEKIFIEVVGHGPESSIGRAIIKGQHSSFVYLQSGNRVLLDAAEEKQQENKEAQLLYRLSIASILQTIEEIPASELHFLLEGLEMNERVARAGLNKRLGMGVGYTLMENIASGILADDLMNYAKILTAAASDARMSGISLPVMSSNGSGNNGLTAILPIAAYRSKYAVNNDRLARALAMSHIMNSYIKHYIGRLSSLCGCAVAAGTGASVAIAWLMGANTQQIEGAIKNILGDISGMVCDGAKVGCALKLSTSASAAIQAALLAINNQVIPAGNGIIAETAEETIRNLKLLSEEGMGKADEVIIRVMRKRFGMEIA